MKRPCVRSRAGFALVEIMIVTGILAFLVAVAMPTLQTMRSNARTNICISNQKAIYTAASMYMMTETTNLESLGDAERLNALITAGYLRGNKWCECPSSTDGDNDDYTMTFQDNFINDVNCDEDPTGHVWP